MTLTRILTVATTGAALAFAPVAMTSVAAQEASASEQPKDGQAEPQATAPEQPKDAQSEEVSADKIDAFVLAAIDVSEARESYAASFEAAEDDTQRQGVLEEAQKAMIKAVEDAEGITVEEYLQISNAAQADEKLNERIMARLQEKTQPKE